MADAVKIKLGLSGAERTKQNAQSNYTKGYTPAAITATAPQEVEAKVGYVPTGATGVVPQSTIEIESANYVAPVVASKLESIGATLSSNLAVDLWRNARSVRLYDRDPDFASGKLSDEFFTKHGAGSPLEVKYLADAKSYQDWEDKTGYILDNRMALQAQSDNPITSAIVSFADIDLALTAIPFIGVTGKAAKLAKGASNAQRIATGAKASTTGLRVGAAATTGGRIAQRAGASVVAGSSMVALQSLQGNSTLRTEAQQMGDVAVVGLARAFAPIYKGRAVVATPRAVGTGYAGDVVPVNQSTFRGAPKPLPLTPIQKAAQVAEVAKANAVGLTDEAIAALPKQVRGAARIRRAAERREAVQKATANTIAPPVQRIAGAQIAPVLDNTPRLTSEEVMQNQLRTDAITDAKTIGMSDTAIAALPAEERAAQRVLRKAERTAALKEAKAMPVAIPKVLTAEQQGAQAAAELTEATQAKIIEDELVHIVERARTESPPQAVARHPIIAKLQSVADEMNFFTGGDTNTVVNKLYSNPAVNNGDDVVSTQNVYLNNYKHKLIAFEDAMADAVAVLVKGKPFARFNGEYTAARRSVDGDFQQAMQRLDSEVLELNRTNGVVPDNATIHTMIDAARHHPALAKTMKAYVDSDLAVQAYKDAYSKGWALREVVDDAGITKVINGFDDIVQRPTYTPLRHSYDKMDNVVFSGKATWDDMADFVGAQIAKMYPDLLNPKNVTKTFVLTERQIGQHFIQTQKVGDRSLTAVTATGMNREQITDLLTKTGNFSDKDARVLADNIFDEMHKKGTAVPKNLRRRIDWDWNLTRKTASGEEISMRDFVDDNIMGTLEDYTRSMAYKNGLADYGIMSETQLVNLLDSYMDKLPAGSNVQQVRQFVKNTVDTMMGRAIETNPIPQGIRSAQAIADLFLLAASGLYTFVDIATQLTKVGVLRSASGVKQGLRASFGNLSKLSYTEAKSFEDIISGKLLAGSKFKNFNTRYADSFEVSGGIHEAAQFYGQTARFLNFSESLKRFQVGMLSSVYLNNLKGVMTGSAKELEFMRNKLFISDETIGAMRKEYAKHGTKIDDWSNGVRVQYERAVFHDADNLAMNVHRGEVPAILEFSSVGRVIFPYMRYMFGMQNKVLRRTINRDGYAGLAMLLAVQIPTATMVAAANNVRKGKEYDDNLLVGALRSATVFGSLNYPMEIMLAGLEGDGATALVPFSRTYKLADELITGGGDETRSLRSIKQNSPLNAATGLDLFLLALEED